MKITVSGKEVESTGGWEISTIPWYLRWYYKRVLKKAYKKRSKGNKKEERGAGRG